MGAHAHLIETPRPASGNGAIRRPTIAGEPVDPAELRAEVEPLDAAEAIAWALERFHPRVRFAVSFQKTSSVVVDLAHRIDPEARFFYVDTGLLFPETHATRIALADRYGIEFERFADFPEPDAPVELRPGSRGEAAVANLLRRDPDVCCADRKVELMGAALAEVDCWVSGIRRVDSATRAEAPKFDWDARFGLWKLNPLADWDDKRVWTYIKERQVPYNPLHDQGYPSIGCVPCTTTVADGDAARAGRWADSERTECGIHG